jgi:hypothetical protein
LINLEQVEVNDVYVAAQAVMAQVTELELVLEIMQIGSKLI